MVNRVTQNSIVLNSILNGCIGLNFKKMYDGVRLGYSCFDATKKYDNSERAKMMDHFVRSTSFSSTGATRPSSIKIKGYNFIELEIIPGCYITKCDYTNTNNLKDDLKVRLALMAQKAEDMGYTLVLGDGFRTHAQQRAAYKAKPSQCAKEGESAHEYGAAMDLVFVKKDKNGKYTMSNDFRNIPELVEFAKSIGIDWGLEVCGRPDSEYWHFQLANWSSRPDIAPEYNRYNNKGSFYCVRR